VGFGWLTLIGFSFSKDFLGAHFKKFAFFSKIRRSEEWHTALRGIIQGPPDLAAETAAITTLRERYESLDRASRSDLLVRHLA